MCSRTIISNSLQYEWSIGSCLDRDRGKAAMRSGFFFRPESAEWCFFAEIVDCNSISWPCSLIFGNERKEAACLDLWEGSPCPSSSQKLCLLVFQHMVLFPDQNSTVCSVMSERHSFFSSEKQCTIASDGFWRLSTVANLSWWKHCLRRWLFLTSTTARNYGCQWSQQRSWKLKSSRKTF